MPNKAAIIICLLALANPDSIESLIINPAAKIKHMIAMLASKFPDLASFIAVVSGIASCFVLSLANTVLRGKDRG